jgi:arabinosaccharide transport system substrate-binding protein
MKKSLLWITVLILSISIIAVFSFTGCKGAEVTEEEAPTVEEPATEEPAAEEPVKEAEVTTLEVWSFVQPFLNHYEKMAGLWNEENPDRQIELKPTLLEWGPMHDKLAIVLQSGEGVPDIVDIEIGKWPNFMTGEVPFVDLTPYAEDYIDDIVESRLEIYSKNGKIYGAPTHVGATVMYYNVDLIEPAGIDYTTLVTWDDFEDALRTYKEATGKYMTYAETYGAYQFTYLLTQQGKDLIDEEGMPNIDTPEALKAVSLIQKWVKEDIAGFIPTGNADTAEGKAAVAAGDIAALGYPFWYMSRLVDEMPDLSGKIAIAPLPVFEVGQPRSVGLGGTGTVAYANGEHADLAAEFIVYAKLSPEGNRYMWTDLGYDPVNKSIWGERDLTHDEGNKFIQYFINNPFDALMEIEDEIMCVKTMQNSGIINDYLSANTFNRIYVNLEDPATVLAETQRDLMNEAKPAE